MTQLVTLAQPGDVAAEAFRGLRTNLEAVAEGAQALLFASPAPGAGAPAVVANLAVVTAQAGRKVVAVDADLRHPSLHELLGVEATPGLSAALDGAAEGARPVAVPGVPRLSVLPAGSPRERPADLLATPGLDAIVAELRAEGDRVLMLAPPILAASDAATLARHVDGVILIMALGKTRKDETQQAREVLERVGARILGVVLTGASADQAGYGHFGEAEPGAPS